MAGGPPSGGPGNAGSQGAPGSGGADVKGWTVEADQGVRIAGSLKYAGSQKGTLRIDFRLHRQLLGALWRAGFPPQDAERQGGVRRLPCRRKSRRGSPCCEAV